jgi:hypothetical protein
VIFLVLKFHHFGKKKSPKQHGQGNFLENFQKIITFQRFFFLKSPRFLEVWGKFFELPSLKIAIFS